MQAGKRASLVVGALSASWIVVTALLTLTPGFTEPGLAPPTETWCLFCGDLGASDALLNLALFLPVGLVVGALGAGWRLAIAVGALASLGIELTQLLLPGRHPTPADLLWNAAGAGLGVPLHVTLRRALEPSASGSRTRGGLVAGTAIGLVVLAAGAALTPHPTDDDYWGQWTPDLGHMPRYEGRVQRFELDGRPVPSGLMAAASEARHLFEGDWRLDVVALKGAPPEAVSPIASIYDASQREIVLLGADGEDLVWRERLWASALKLDQPHLRLPDALIRVDAGEWMELSVEARGHMRCVVLDGERVCRGGFPFGRTWSLLREGTALSELGRRVVDVLWLLLLAFPIGFFARSRGEALAGGSLLGILGALAVGLTPLSEPSTVEALAGVAGVTGGWTGVRLLRSLFHDRR
jgi:hypothetical protein